MSKKDTRRAISLSDDYFGKIHTKIVKKNTSLPSEGTTDFTIS